MQTIKDLQKESEMPCFSPENVVFIANKWDLVVKQIEKTDEDSSDSDDEDESEIWEQIKSDIKQEWPLVTEEHILKMTLKDVTYFILLIIFHINFIMLLYEEIINKRFNYLLTLRLFTNFRYTLVDVRNTIKNAGDK